MLFEIYGTFFKGSVKYLFFLECTGEFFEKKKIQQKLLKIAYIYPFLRADFEYHNFTATILTFMTENMLKMR